MSGRSLRSHQLGIVDQRVEAWFERFWGIPTTGHLTEPQQRLGSTVTAGFRPGLLIPVAAADGESVGIDDRERFRVCIRVREDAFLQRSEFDRMPDSWTYYVTAATAAQAVIEPCSCSLRALTPMSSSVTTMSCRSSGPKWRVSRSTCSGLGSVRRSRPEASTTLESSHYR